MTRTPATSLRLFSSDSTVSGWPSLINFWMMLSGCFTLLLMDEIGFRCVRCPSSVSRISSFVVISLTAHSYTNICFLNLIAFDMKYSGILWI